MNELKSYVVNYDVEYKVKPNDFTEVVIKTKYTNPSLVARENDIEKVAENNFSVHKENHCRLLYNKIQQDMNFYDKLEYIKNVSSKLINTTCSPTENFKTAYKINQITMLDAENSEEINEDDIVIKQQEENNND